MMDLILFLAGIFLITFVIGKLLEKFKIPWIFSTLLIGLALSAHNPFESVTSSSNFLLLSYLVSIGGMNLSSAEAEKA